jgi:hypothetical protein
VSADATRLRQALVRWSDDVNRKGARETIDAMRPEAPRGKPDPLGRGYVGGETQRSLRHTGGTTDGQRSRQRVEAPTKQAEYSDQVQPPHVITPRGPGYPLRFHWPKAGGVVHLMRVNHPGNAGDETGSLGWWERLLRKHWPAQLRRAARSTPFH